MLPRLLILDDVFGRNVPDGRNSHREYLCAHFLWLDATGDASARSSQQKILKPTAEAIFCRAQSPSCATIGDIVENDLETALDTVRFGRPQAAGARRGSKSKPPHPRWSMILIDLCFHTGPVTEESHRNTPGMPEGRPGDDDPRFYFGLTLLDVIHREFPDLPILILSSKPREEVSLEFSRRGALGFIDRSALEGPELLQKALWNHGLLPDTAGEIVGTSLPLLLALREARRAASHSGNILLQGKSGTGKELMARYLHRISPAVEGRETRAFLSVNPASLSPDLATRDLFGIEPKTASDVVGRVGLIEMANGGDLFLDEIAGMSEEMQLSLLRTVQEGQVVRAGGRQPRDVKVRYLSATNADPSELRERVRGDLLSRLSSGGVITMPTLKDRADDVPLLAERFVREAEAQRGDAIQREIADEALDALMDATWPGNVRDLRTLIYDAVNRHPGVEHLVREHLRFENLPGADTEGGGTYEGRKSRKRAGSEGDLTLKSLFKTLKQVRLDPSNPEEWVGALPDWQNAQARLAGRILEAAIQRTKRYSPDHMKGIIQIHPAARMATGDATLTAVKAADLFKRILGPLEPELEGDLLEAYRISLRLRPKSNSRPASATAK